MLITLLLKLDKNIFRPNLIPIFQKSHGHKGMSLQKQI